MGRVREYRTSCAGFIAYIGIGVVVGPSTPPMAARGVRKGEGEERNDKRDVNGGIFNLISQEQKQRSEMTIGRLTRGVKRFT